MIQCNKCKATAYSIHGKCLACGNAQFKSKATIVKEVNTIVDNMIADKVDKVIQYLIK